MFGGKPANTAIFGKIFRRRRGNIKFGGYGG